MPGVAHCSFLPGICRSSLTKTKKYGAGENSGAEALTVSGGLLSVGPSWSIFAGTQPGNFGG